MVCNVCENYLSLLLQLHANLPERFPDHERRLFVFGCRKKTCQRKSGCIRAFRSVKRLPARRPNQSAASHHDTTPSNPCASRLGDAIFGSMSPLERTRNANPFTISPKSFEAETSIYPGFILPVTENNHNAQLMPNKVEVPQISLDCSSPEDTLRQPSRKLDHNISLPNPVGVAQHETAPLQSFPLYHLEADFETLDNSSINSTSFDVRDLETSLPSSNDLPVSTDDSETFESTLDKVFQRFADRLAQNPLQVLRYEFSGVPMLYSIKDDIGKRLTGALARQNDWKANHNPTRTGYNLNVPACINCGSHRVFELQLTPHAISLLEVNEAGLDGMEWGTIIVGVCESDCVKQNSNEFVGYAEEWVGVQWEEM